MYRSDISAYIQCQEEKQPAALALLLDLTTPPNE